jgi:hypothetical protein
MRNYFPLYEVDQRYFNFKDKNKEKYIKVLKRRKIGFCILQFEINNFRRL